MSQWSNYGFPDVLGLPTAVPLLGILKAINERVEKLQLPYPKLNNSDSNIQDLSSLTLDDVLGTSYRGRTSSVRIQDYSLAGAVGNFCYWFVNSYLRNESTAAGYLTNFRLFMLDEISDLNTVASVTWSDFTAWFETKYGISYQDFGNYWTNYTNNFSSYDSLMLLYRMVNRIHYTSTGRIRYFEKKGNKASYRYVTAEGDDYTTAYQNAVSALLSTDWTTYTLSADNDRQLPDEWNVTQIGTFGTQVYSSTYPRTSTITQRWLLDGTDPTTSGVYDGFAYPLTGELLPASAAFGISWTEPTAGWEGGPHFKNQEYRNPTSGWYSAPFVLDRSGGYYANFLSGTSLAADGNFIARRIRLQWNDVIVDAGPVLDFFDEGAT